MSNLSNIEERRLHNLRLLHGGATPNGAPTSDLVVDFLTSKGVSITKGTLSDVYWKKQAIDSALASRIEKAFDLPAGWLSEDQTFWLSVRPEDLAVLKAFAALPESAKKHLGGIVQLLGTPGAH